MKSSGFSRVEQALLQQLTDVVQAIERDPSCDRIKKLMAFSCYRVWNGQNQSLNLDLRHLVGQILNHYSTPEELQAKLYYLASTLNKTAEYTLVANTILSYLAPVYTQQQAPSVETAPLDFVAVALQLQHDPDALRIKKLLLCACGHPWQNDVAILDGIAMEGLVSQMRQIAPTYLALKATLESVVTTLNRAQVYAVIAQRVVNAFVSLYEEATGPLEPPITSNSTDCTEALDPSPTPAAIPTAMSDVTMDLSVAGSLAGVNPPPTKTDPVDMKHSSSASASSNRPLTLSLLAKTLPRVQLEMADLYDLRLEIVKYTSPLRAKVLLFSMLRQHTDWSGHDYSMLKATDLSALLNEMFQTYKQLEHVCPVLQRVAAELTPSTDYLQACGAIVRAIAPWYNALDLSPHATGKDDQTVPDLSAGAYVEQTDVQFNQAEITGMATRTGPISEDTLYESA